MNNVRALQASKFQDFSNGVPTNPIWFFALPTKAFNIHNFSTKVASKVGMHLGVIGLHPLHFPPFARVCFTTKHIFNLVDPCTSHLIVNLMLRLRHIVCFSFNICKLLYDLDLILYQQLVLIVPLVTIQI